MTRPRLLLLVPTTYFQQFGGAEQVVRSYEKMAVAWGFEVAIGIGGAASNESILPSNYYPIVGWPPYYSEFNGGLVTIRIFRRLVGSFRPQIVHALSVGSLDVINHAFPSSRPFRSIFSFFETPYRWPIQSKRFSQVLGPDGQFLTDPWSEYREGARRIIANGKIDAFVPFSTVYLDWGFDFLSVSRTIPCVMVLPYANGDDDGQKLSTIGKLTLPDRFALSVARLVPRKGILGLLTSLQDSQIHLLITDSRPTDRFHTKFREAVVQKVKGSKNFELLPSDMDECHLSDLYRRAEFVLYPSLHEGYGLVPLEASRVRRPTIGFDIPGTCHTLMDKQNGWRVPAYDWRKMKDLAIQVWSRKLKIDSCELAASHERTTIKSVATWESLRELLYSLV